MRTWLTRFINSQFPRVEVLLDQASLRPTDECLKDWNNTKGVDELKERFFDKYGTPNTQNWIEILKNSLDYPGRYFPTRIQLGGKLTTSQEHNAKDNVSIEEKKKAMRWSAGVSFNTPWGGASFNTSHGKQSGSLANTNDANMTGNMNWEACGGDTLLGNRYVHCQCSSWKLHWLIYPVHPTGVQLLARFITGGLSM